MQLSLGPSLIGMPFVKVSFDKTAHETVYFLILFWVSYKDIVCLTSK